MAGAFDRVPGIDHDNLLPLPVRQKLASNFSDTSTPEGAALDANIVSKSSSWAPVNLGNRAGSVSLSGVPLGSIVSITLTGSITIPSSGRPGVPAGSVGSVILRLQQDATGGRSIIAEGAKTASGMPLEIAQSPGEVSLVELLWTGFDWWLIGTAPYGAVPPGW